jgi:uncharacterized protein (TIGR02145 family)
MAQVPCSPPSVAGKLTYDNLQNTPLEFSTIYLKTLTGMIVDSATTDHFGNYFFCNVPGGSYKLKAATSKPCGGVNSSDALVALKHFAQMITLTGLPFKAADVNGNSYINSVDALLIAKRFVNLITAFPVGDWSFEEPEVTISGASNQTVDIKGLCTGDPNGSYIPPVTFICGDTLVDERDGQKYPTVKIENQCWMKNNLNAGIQINCTVAPANNGIIEKYCYANEQDNCAIYGGLYTWAEMMAYSTATLVQGVCPVGWHIPTYPDWDTLVAYFGGYVIAGGKMKEPGYTHWLWPNTGADNSSLFMALGAGYPYGSFNNINISTYFWSSYSEFSPLYGPGAGGIVISYDNLGVNQSSGFSMGLGFSVRCIKDTCILVGNAYTGPDHLNISGTVAMLSANLPAAGEGGVRQVVSGVSGSFENSNNPITRFFGSFGNSYTFRWTISNACESTSDDINISFLPIQSCPGISSFIYGGQTYYTVQIGSQCWMRENLNIGAMVNSLNTGSSHSECANNGIIEKYCYNNDLAICAIYGGLYDWNEIMQYTDIPGGQGICPNGWHIPTFDEWCTLTTFLDSTWFCQSNHVMSGLYVGDKMKESGTSHWGPNTNDNSSGFTALGDGMRAPSGNFSGLTIYTDYWTSSEVSLTDAIGISLIHHTPSISCGGGKKTYGNSVRCLKN